MTFGLGIMTFGLGIMTFGLEIMTLFTFFLCLESEYLFKLAVL
jgi:hypothetical protein